MANFGGDDIDKVITGGIVFSGGAKKTSGNSKNKVKTKAKKKAYITGAHGSGSAKMKLKSAAAEPTGIKSNIFSHTKEKTAGITLRSFFSSLRER